MRSFSIGALCLAAALPLPGATQLAGSAACSGCHRAIYEKFRGSAMGRSLEKATEPATLSLAPAPVSVESPTLGRRYRIWRDKDSLVVSESNLDPAKGDFQASYPLAYTVGSGANGMSFLVRRGDHLFQSPVSYYARRKTWDLSPGFENADYGFNRPALPGCVACHSGQPRPVAGRNGQFEDPPFRELAIGCENCHGSGLRHIAARGRGAIVNPAKLTRDLAEDICRNCHQGGDTRVLMPGRKETDHEAGAPLLRTVAIYALRRGSQAPDDDLLEHHESMKRSRCYVATSGKLGCLSCHDPHSSPAPEERSGYFRAKCLQCHAAASCKSPDGKRAGSDCASCHMPKRDIRTIAHSALTNHRIPALPGARVAAPAQSGPAVIQLLNPAAGVPEPPEIVRLQAYGHFLERDPELLPQYVELLGKLSRSLPKDPLVLAAQARYQLRSEGGAAAAIPLLKEAIEKGSVVYTTYQDLAEGYGKTGQEAEAAQALERAVEIAPYIPELRKALVLRYIRLKRYGKAQEGLKDYVELFPEDDFMRGLRARAASLPVN